MHPLIGNLSELKDTEIDAKIGELTKKYFMTNNPGLQAQMVAVLDTYKEEQSKRQRLALEKLMANRDKTLDKLVKVN
jgi:hypothetical protein